MGSETVCCSRISSGYPLHTMVYCRKKRSQPASQFCHSYDVVRELMLEASLLDKGYHLYVDNFYTSPTLAEFLYTQRANRKGIPVMIKSAKPKEGECFYARKRPLACIIMERKAVTEEPLPYANFWEWCSDDQPHPSQWSDKGVDRRKFTRFRFMCTLVEELCATPEDQPVAIPIPVRQANLVHRAVLLPGKKEKDCVVCSDRSTAAGRKRSRTQCESCGIGAHLKCLISLTMLQKRENKQTTSFETQFLMGCHDELLFTVICQSYSVVHLTSACHEPLHSLFLSVCIWKKRVSIM